MYNVSGLRRRRRWGRRTAWSCSAWPGGRRTDPSTSRSELPLSELTPGIWTANKEKTKRGTLQGKKQRAERRTSFIKEVKPKYTLCWDLVLSNRYPCMDGDLRRLFKTSWAKRVTLHMSRFTYKISSAIYCIYRKRVCWFYTGRHFCRR